MRSGAFGGNLRGAETVRLDAVRELRVERARVLHIVERPGAAWRRIARLEIRRVRSFEVARDEILVWPGIPLLRGDSLSAEDHDPGVGAHAPDGEARAGAPGDRTGRAPPELVGDDVQEVILPVLVPVAIPGGRHTWQAEDVRDAEPGGGIIQTVREVTRPERRNVVQVAQAEVAVRSHRDGHGRGDR